MFTPVRGETAVDVVLRQFKDLLIRGAVRPGDRLPSEPQLVEQLGISRGPIREAMKILKSFGIVDIRPGDGTYVATESRGSIVDPLLFQLILSRPDKRQLYELRAAMETSLASLVLQNATETDVAELSRIVESMADAQTADAATEERIELDLAFHRRFAAASRNPLMEKIYRFVLEFLEPSIRETYGTDKEGQPVEVHTAILDALAARDARGLREAVGESIDVWNRLST